jgi:hypothetical protein
MPADGEGLAVAGILVEVLVAGKVVDVNVLLGCKAAVGCSAGVCEIVGETEVWLGSLVRATGSVGGMNWVGTAVTLSGGLADGSVQAAKVMTNRQIIARDRFMASFHLALGVSRRQFYYMT